VKPENMRRNLDRSGGVVLSEAVMMALAPEMGRDQAHALVLRLSREALARGRPFRDVVAADPEVRRHLTPRQVSSVLGYENGLGPAADFVDRGLSADPRNPGRPGRPRTQPRP